MSATVRKNAREELRVSLNAFRGRMLLDLRVWFADGDGEMRPGKRGVAIGAELQAALDKLASGEA
jgi:hypothetical protein